MDAEFARDALFTAAWFGLMTTVWLGWAQEDPPRPWRIWLGIGSGAGALVAVGFGVAVASHWDAPTALSDRYGWFGVLVAAQVVAAGLGSLLLARRGRARWMAWWVALVVAVHFVPLGWLLDFGLVGALGIMEATALLLLVPRLRASTRPTSAPVGAVMGCSLLLGSMISGAVGLS